MTDLHHTVLGKGPPILFMHGGLGLDHTVFRPYVDPLSTDYTLILYDHRGNGRSPRPRDSGSLTHEMWVTDAERLRQTLGIDRWVVFGDSYGGVIAQEYAIRHADHLNGLVLCATAPAYDHAGKAMQRIQSRGTPEQLDALAQAMTARVPDDETLERLVYQVMPMYLHRPSADLLEGLFGEVTYSAGAFNRAMHELLPTFDATRSLEHVGVPSLIIAGEDDWLCPPEDSIERFVRVLPNAEGAVIKQAGHYPYGEAPEDFCSVLSRWLRKILARDPC